MDSDCTLAVELKLYSKYEVYDKNVTRVGMVEICGRFATVVKQDVLFVVDTSMSMKTKTELLKKTLLTVIDTLPDEIRVGVVAFCKEARSLCTFSDDLCREELKINVVKLANSYGTNISEAFRVAFELLRLSNYPNSIIFLTDGLPTFGLLDSSNLLEYIADMKNDLESRIHVMGIGLDVDHAFLRELSSQHMGQYNYLADSGDIPHATAACLSRIMHGAGRDISIRLSSSEVMLCDGHSGREIFLKKVGDLAVEESIRKIFSMGSAATPGKTKIDVTVYWTSESLHEIVGTLEFVTEDKNSAVQKTPRDEVVHEEYAEKIRKHVASQNVSALKDILKEMKSQEKLFADHIKNVRQLIKAENEGLRQTSRFNLSSHVSSYRDAPLTYLDKYVQALGEYLDHLSAVKESSVSIRSKSN
jgi:hypothetical protein